MLTLIQRFDGQVILIYPDLKKEYFDSLEKAQESLNGQQVIKHLHPSKAERFF